MQVLIEVSMTGVINVFWQITYFIGYDLRQVNLYISKLFENIGCLVYNEVDDEDLKFNFLVTGIQSHMGETLPLKQVGLPSIFKLCTV